MSLDEQLLAFLVCPETREPLRLADAHEIAALNDHISRGALQNRAGDQVDERIDGALIRADGQCAYAIREDIPVLLIDEGIPLD